MQVNDRVGAGSSTVAGPLPVSTPASPRPPRGCTNLKLRQASRLVARLYDAEVSPSGLQKTQYSLLSHVVKLGPVSAGQLAHAMQIDASTLSRNLQPLVKAGWVEVACGDDARQRLIAATAEGVALRAEAQRAWKRAQLGLNRRLGESDVAELHALLDRLIEVLGGDDEGASTAPRAGH